VKETWDNYYLWKFSRVRHYWNEKTYLGYHLPLDGVDCMVLMSKSEKLSWFHFIEKMKVKLILRKSDSFQSLMIGIMAKRCKLLKIKTPKFEFDGCIYMEEGEL